MRIVSYNVRYFGHGLRGLASTAGSKSKIAAAVAQLTPGPDLIALQEVETRSLRATLAHRGSHQAETQLEAFMRHFGAALARHGQKTPWVAHYFPAHAYQLGGVKLYTTGLAVLVNADTLQVVRDNRHAPEPITHYGKVRVTKQTRIVAHLHLENRAGRTFHLFNTHLSLPSPFRRDFWAQDVRMGHGPNQVAEATRVLDYARHTAGKEPFLLMGDFNSAPASPVYRLLTDSGKLIGAQAQLGQIDPEDPRGFSTAGFLKLRMHLDHLFGSRGMEWTGLEGTYAFGDASGPFHGLSDHVPLIATVEPG